jgi:uroporphyrinogen decarboxylase
MNKRDRLQAAMRGEVAVDRVPVSLWRHFPVDDQYPDQLAAATLEFQNLYDFDFVKVTPSSSFCIRDWGARDEWRGNPEGTRDYTHRVIARADDWTRLQPLDPRAGALGDQLRALRLIRDGLPPSVPVIQTVFSPISQARNLIGADKFPSHARQYTTELKAALGVITETCLRFVDEAKKIGVDGIFYAVQFASTRIFSEPEYHELGEPHDRKILDAVSDRWLNVLHLHGDDVMFDLISRYPAQVINWHDRETPPTLVDGKKKFKGAVCGGLRQWETMVRGNPDSVRAEAKDAIETMNGRGLILGTGCVTPITTPRANLRAARDVVEK